jgi:hypothetical protein
MIAPGVRFTIAGMLLLAASLLLKHLLPVAEGEARDWVWRFHWTCWIIGGGCVLYGVARIFALKDE